MVCDFFDRRVYIDLAIFAAFGLVHSIAWLEVKLSRPESPVNNEALSRAAQAGMSGLGILIAASFVVLQLARSTDNALPASVAEDVFFASLWFLAALVMALTVLWRLAMYPEHHKGLVLDVGILFGLQLLASVIGVGRLVVSLTAAI